MSRNIKSLDLRKKVQARASKFCAFWKDSNILGQQTVQPTGADFEDQFRNIQKLQTELGLQRPNSSPLQNSLKNQRGFAQAFFISLLPILLAGFLVILFSQFFLKNWMQSLHTCRVELLTSQQKTKRHLKQLMDLNTLAKSLRLALMAARARLAVATASQNWPMVAEATRAIIQIEAKRKQLGLLQKSLILQANFEMAKGVESVARKIRQQSQHLQNKLPKFLAFRIHSIRPQPSLLAVQPDRPDTAPVYELQTQFKDRQALHVSWISEFQTRKEERYQWLLNHHKKQDGCSASLEPKGKDFQEILHEGRSFLKL